MRGTKEPRERGDASIRFGATGELSAFDVGAVRFLALRITNDAGEAFLHPSQVVLRRFRCYNDCSGRDLTAKNAQSAAAILAAKRCS